jgi:uncharacterized protein (DUF4415 family)
MAKMKRRSLSEAAAEVEDKAKAPSETSEQEAGEAASRDAGKKTGRPEREDKPVKVTVYLDADANDALKEAWFRLRRQTGRKLSKSAIASAALRLATRDLDELLDEVETE